MQIPARVGGMAPAQRARRRVDGDHIGAAGREVQGALIQDRRRLECRPAPILDAFAEFAGPECPGDFECGDVRGRDRAER
jgi:hypothetical protein